MYGPASDPSQKLRSRMVMQVHDELGVCCGARRS
jgi:DNA polymerase I-like protein with 3'-5' exonuclease and polymerase domains